MAGSQQDGALPKVLEAVFAAASGSPLLGRLHEAQEGCSSAGSSGSSMQGGVAAAGSFLEVVDCFFEHASPGQIQRLKDTMTGESPSAALDMQYSRSVPNGAIQDSHCCVCISVGTYACIHHVCMRIP
jgi:hypothetical protein